MGGEILWGLGGAVRFQIARARDELSVQRSDASCYQVGVLEMANPNRTIKTLCDEIHKAIAVIGMDVELRVASRHFREYGREMGRTKSKRGGNAQAAAKVSGGQHRLLGRIDLGAGSGGMFPKRGSGFGERGATRGSCKKLDPQFLFKPAESPTDDGLGDTEPARGGRNPTGIGHFYECPQVLDFQLSVPDCAT